MFTNTNCAINQVVYSRQTHRHTREQIPCLLTLIPYLYKLETFDGQDVGGYGYLNFCIYQESFKTLKLHEMAQILKNCAGF